MMKSNRNFTAFFIFIAMGYLRKTSFLSYPLVVFFIVSIYISNVCALRGVFNLKMKSKDLSILKRQTPHRMLTAGSAVPMDFHIGGNDTAWDYLVEVTIGTPPQNFLFLLDTGSDITWINCQGCDGCPTDDNEKGIHLKSYNPEASTTAEIIKHDDLFCRKPDRPCAFNISYFDGTAVTGYYVKDYVTYNKVTSNHNTEPAKAEFTFGCTTKQVSQNNAYFLKRGMVGTLGLGTHRSTIFSQMNASNTARNMFSICLDKNRGGGIFAAGKLLKPTVPMMNYFDNDYQLKIQSMMFGEVKIELNATTALAIFDTGSSVGFIPASTQIALADLIASKFSVVPETYYASHCFRFPGMNVTVEVLEKVLPTWTFRFSDTMSLPIYPRNYMTKLIDDHVLDRWCIKTNKHDIDGLFLLGVPFMSEKLFVYDNEDKSIGFMDYDCTSSIEVEGDDTNEVSEVDSHDVEPHF